MVIVLIISTDSFGQSVMCIVGGVRFGPIVQSIKVFQRWVNMDRA